MTTQDSNKSNSPSNKSSNEREETPTEKLEREIDERNAAFNEKQTQLLEEAKRNADENKEPFSLDELKEYYSFASDFVPLYVTQLIPDAEIERIEMIYYVKYPKIKTMEELGEFLTRLDAYG
jgi:hypothetical protein